MNNQPANKKNLLFALLLAAILIAGALFYFFWNKSAPQTPETPPSISISTGNLKGQLAEDPVCQIPGMHQFTDSQAVSYNPVSYGFEAVGGSNWHILEPGIHIYHSDENLTVQQIINRIVPAANNKILLAYYPSGDENTGKKFAVYPGLEGQTAVNNEYLIPANQGFIIFSCKEAKIWKVNNEKTPATQLSPLLSGKTIGWVLIPTINGADLKTSLAAHQSKITSIWMQKGSGFVFPESRTLDNVSPDSTYRMMWLKFGQPTVIPPSDSTPNVNLAVETPTGDLIPATASTFFKLKFSSDRETYIKKIDLKVTSASPGTLVDLEKIELLEDITALKSANLSGTGGVVSFDFTDQTGGGLKLAASNVIRTLSINLTPAATALNAGKHKIEITNVEYTGTTNKSTTYPGLPITSSERTVKADPLLAGFSTLCLGEKTATVNQQIAPIHLYIVSLVKEISLKELVFTYKTPVSLPLTDVKLYMSTSSVNCNDTDAFTEVSTQPVVSNNLGISLKLDQDKIKIMPDIQLKKPVYLKITGKIPDTAAAGSTYTLGISQNTDIRMHEANIDIKPLALFSETLLPLYGPTYTVVNLQAPGQPKVTSISSAGVKLEWTAPENFSLKPITHYRISKADGTCAAKTNLSLMIYDSIDSATGNLNYTLEGLQKDGKYAVIVQAYNGSATPATATEGWSEISACTEFENSMPSITFIQKSAEAPPRIALAWKLPLSYKLFTGDYRIEWAEGQCNSITQYPGYIDVSNNDLSFKGADDAFRGHFVDDVDATKSYGFVVSMIKDGTSIRSDCFDYDGGQGG